jgi:hypothetical protein
MDPGVWFSLGFEAFDGRGEVASILEEALRSFFTKHGPPPGIKLEEANSLSYPAWLSAFPAGQDNSVH